MKHNQQSCWNMGYMYQGKRKFDFRPHCTYPYKRGSHLHSHNPCTILSPLKEIFNVWWGCIRLLHISMKPKHWLTGFLCNLFTVVNHDVTYGNYYVHLLIKKVKLFIFQYSVAVQCWIASFGYAILLYPIKTENYRKPCWFASWLLLHHILLEIASWLVWNKCFILFSKDLTFKVQYLMIWKSANVRRLTNVPIPGFYPPWIDLTMRGVLTWTLPDDASFWRRLWFYCMKLMFSRLETNKNIITTSN